MFNNIYFHGSIMIWKTSYQEPTYFLKLIKKPSHSFWSYLYLKNYGTNLVEPLIMMVKRYNNTRRNSISSSGNFSTILNAFLANLRHQIFKIFWQSMPSHFSLNKRASFSKLENWYCKFRHEYCMLWHSFSSVLVFSLCLRNLRNLPTRLRNGMVLNTASRKYQVM
jgi:hypothetical protein